MIRKANHTASAAGILIAVALGLAVTPQSAAQVTGPADKISATPAATASVTKAEPTRLEWGQGVLEAEFLTKLRLFLERDPLDYKEFERVFGVKLEVHPKEGPYHDGSWGIHAVGPIPPPFGREFRGGGYGPTYSFIPGRSSNTLRIELVKPPPRGWTQESKLPCIEPSLFVTALDHPSWAREQLFSRDHGVPIPTTDQYRFLSPSGLTVSMTVTQRAQCTPYLLISLPVSPIHPNIKPSP